MDDLLSEFLTETGESLATLDVELVNFEQNPNDKAILSNIFRLVHTIKGTCGFLGLPRLEHMAHAGENVLGKIRDGELEVTPNVVTLIFQCLDQIKGILAYIEENETEPEGDDQELINALNATAEGISEVSATATEPVPAAEPAMASIVDTEPKEASAPPPELEQDEDEGFPVAAELLAEVEEAYAQGKKAASIVEIEAEMQAERDKDSSKKPYAKKPPLPPAVKTNVPAAVPKTEAQKSGDHHESSVANQSIRVNVDLLEVLMNQVSELVLVRNSLLQMVRNVDNSEFVTPLQRLSHITTELQEGIMKTRMQPIGNAWAKLPRIIRDLSVEIGKKLDLVMIGSETELDRQVLELIKDPLTHMVRNSADHGIEMPHERVAAGKKETGTITLNAYHEGGHIIIEIKDDGRGLNIQKIKEKAIMNNLATEAELDAMSDQQVGLFIFKPGFSTAEKVTSVSGRGVGMDVVRTNIDKIGGTIELKTAEGKGSTFIIKIPLTLAIVSALIVSVGSERFAIPQISVLELVRITKESEQAIETINNAPVLRLRNRLLPLVNLSKLLKIEGKEPPVPVSPVGENTDVAIETLEQNKADEISSLEEGKESFIVVSQVGAYSFGIVVDRVYDTEEIVVKPVSPILRNISIFSGNTILGDGSVIMILDPNGIANAQGDVQTHGDRIDKLLEEQQPAGNETTSILIFRAYNDEVMAVPLALIARLEDIDVSTIEHSNGKSMVQYRDHLMPILTIRPEDKILEEGRQPILVFTDNNRSMGLAVAEILDIVEDKLQVEIKASKPGIVGSAIINHEATDILDIGYYLTAAFGDWFGTSDKPINSAEILPKILIVDDSAFFRNLLTPTLSASGYSVTTAPSAVEALKMRDKGYRFDAIISDIEMPEMDGLDFARSIRKEGIWKDLPLIALSSHAKASDIEVGLEAGFDDYVAKFDKDNLVKIVSTRIANKKVVNKEIKAIAN